MQIEFQLKKKKLQKAYDNEIPRCCSSYRQCGLDQSATHLNISTAHSSVITDDMMDADTGTTEAESILIPVVLVCSCLLLLTLASQPQGICLTQYLYSTLTQISGECVCVYTNCVYVGPSQSMHQLHFCQGYCCCHCKH